MKRNYPNFVITFLLEHNGQFLLIRRPLEEENYGGLWAFPGGKAEIGETPVETIWREVLEETGLSISDEYCPLDFYCFGNSVGMAVLLKASSNNLKNHEFNDFKWVKDLKDLEALPRIDGIDNHLANAIEAYQKGIYLSLNKSNLTRANYLNSGTE